MIDVKAVYVVFMVIFGLLVLMAAADEVKACRDRGAVFLGLCGAFAIFTAGVSVCM